MICKRLFLLSVLLFLAAGCTRELTYKTFELEDSVRLAEMDATCEVSCAFDYLTGGVDKEVMDRINGRIVDRCLLFEEQSGATDVPAACRQWVEEQLGGFDIPESDYDEDNSWMFHFQYDREGRFTTACKSRHLQTYTATYRDYTGGVHEMYGTEEMVFDLTSGAVVSEQDLFVPDYGAGVQELLKASFEAYLAQEELDEDMFFSLPAPNGNFSVSEDVVTWTYNPYEIAPYAMGAVDLTVRWSDLKPYLK